MSRGLFETAVGAMVLLVAAGFLFYASSVANIGATGGYELSIEFDDATGLAAGTDVRIAGVPVGQVIGRSIDPESFFVTVRIRLEDQYQLPTDSVASIASGGLLGDRFLTLEPGIDFEMLGPGDTITFTNVQPSLEELIGQAVFSIQGSGAGN